MKKRWQFYLVLFLLSFSLANAYTNYNTKASCLLMVDQPDVALVNTDFTITAKYYFTNQQVQEVEITFLRNGELFQKKTFTNQETVEITYDLNENQVATYPYAIFVKETLAEDEYVETGFDISMNIISNNIEAVKSRHEVVMVTGSDEIYFDDLSIYEPYALRDKMEYSIIQENPTKIDCSLKDTIISFDITEELWTGRSTCKVKGTYENISLTHTYDLLVMANKAVYIKDLNDVFLDQISEGSVIYPNVIDFCNYQFEPNMKPYIYIASDPKGFNLEIDKNLIIHNITRDLTGKHLIKLGCNDQFREFYFNVNKREFTEYDVNLESMPGKKVLNFGIGTLTLNLPDAITGEKNTVEAVVSIYNLNLHPVENIYLFDMESGGVTEETCEEEICRLDFELESRQEQTKEYAIIIQVENKNPLEFLEIDQNYLINSSDDTFLLTLPFSIEFKSEKADVLPEIKTDLGIIRAPFTYDSENSFKQILDLIEEKTGTPFDLETRKEKLEKTFEILDATKLVGTSVRVDEFGNNMNRAVIKIVITPKKPLKNIVIYEYIPKSNAQSIGGIDFDNSVLDVKSGTFEIIETDPLIAWHFPHLEEQVELKYELEKGTAVLGNTIIFAEEAEREVPAYFYIIVTLFVAVAVTLMIFYNKIIRRPVNRKELKQEIINEARELDAFLNDQEDDFENILGTNQMANEKLNTVKDYIEKCMKAGRKREDIAVALLNKGWPSEIVMKLLDEMFV